MRTTSGARRPTASDKGKKAETAVESIWIVKSGVKSAKALLDSIHNTMVVREAVGELPKGLAVSRLRLFVARLGVGLDEVRVVVDGLNLEIDSAVAV